MSLKENLRENEVSNETATVSWEEFCKIFRAYLIAETDIDPDLAFNTQEEYISQLYKFYRYVLIDNKTLKYLAIKLKKQIPEYNYDFHPISWEEFRNSFIKFCIQEFNYSNEEAEERADFFKFELEDMYLEDCEMMKSEKRRPKRCPYDFRMIFVAHQHGLI